MTQSALPYADVEKLLVLWLGSVLNCRVVTDLPANLKSQVPLLQIGRYGGLDIAPGLDVVDMDVDAYGPDRGSAVSLAEKTRHALRFSLPNKQLDGAVFARVETLAAPTFRPYDNTDLRRFGASYRLYVHVVG